MHKVIGLILLLAMSVATSALFSAVELATVKEECRSLIESNKRNIAGFVRLIFHDCVGGCNGCVDLNLTDAATQDFPNAGLEIYIEPLERAYDELTNGSHSINISRADFWTVCSIVALDEGRDLVHGGEPLDIDMKYGRLDCPGGGDNSNVPRGPSSANFPNPRSGLNVTLDWCSDTFGLAERECVALLGAHTLGIASPRRSGYNGPWVQNNMVLDNAYYIDLLNRTWLQHNRGKGDGVSSARWQYETKFGKNNSRRLMMLNADVCFMKDIQPSDNGKVQEGNDLSTAPDSRTRPYVEEFANDDETWIEAFKQVFKKMVETLPAGNPSLQSII